MKIGKNAMKCKIVFLSTAIITILFLCIPFGGYVQGKNMPFPTYGSGAIQVRIYTDYFCPPCRGMEPAVEPLLRNLIKKNAITLTMVDMPIYRQSPFDICAEVWGQSSHFKRPELRSGIRKSGDGRSHLAK